MCVGICQKDTLKGQIKQNKYKSCETEKLLVLKKKLAFSSPFAYGKIEYQRIFKVLYLNLSSLME